MKALFAILLSLAAAVAVLQSPVPRDAAASTDSLKVGDTAPDFTLIYSTKDSIAWSPVSLASMVGKGPIVIAFYPADWSGGCTKEVCSFRDNFAALSDTKAQVLGISGDYPFSHFEWAKYHTLPFKLGSDHKHEVAAMYGSYDEKSGFNKRTVYVVDDAGKIAYIDMHYSPRDEASLHKLQDALKKVQ